MSAEVWLVTGAQASGKSTVADLLARQFQHGVDVSGGQFYRWAVRGWVEFDDPDQQHEARRLLDLRYRLSARVAVEYASAGFTCVVQEDIDGDDVAMWPEMVQPLTTHLGVLRPDVSIVARRDEARNRATGKVAYRGAVTRELNDAHLATTPRRLGGLWLDSSKQTPTETVSLPASVAGVSAAPVTSAPESPLMMRRPRLLRETGTARRAMTAAGRAGATAQC